MSGHSHWAKIRRSKGATDAKRGKLWSKLARNVIMAARTGGGDPDANLTLRYAIDRARAANMPNDTIDRAIKKGTGELEGVRFESVTYEGYAPGGVAVLIEALTDNRNRTTAEVRKAFELAGGSLGAAGCVSFLFNKKGTLQVRTEDATEDRLMEVCLDAGAEDVRQDGDTFLLTCEVGDFESLKAALTEAEIPFSDAELAMLPTSVVVLNAAIGKKVLSFIETLEDLEDTQDVYANYEMPDEAFAEIEP